MARSCFVILESFATNQLHKWAHAPIVQPLVSRLPDAGLIRRPRAHAARHRPQAEAYCVATGWLNPLLDRVAFFPRAERMLPALALRMSGKRAALAPVSARERGTSSDARAV